MHGLVASIRREIKMSSETNSQRSSLHLLAAQAILQSDGDRYIDRVPLMSNPPRHERLGQQ
jgi:hypothetical protein